MKWWHIAVGLVIGAPAAILSKWPIYGDYWMQHGFWGVVQRDVIGHEFGMLVAILLGLVYIALERYSTEGSQ